jgi:hypothetical protein
MRVCMHTCVCVYIRISVDEYIYIYINIHIYIYVCVYVCVCARVCVCMFMCVCVCARVCICIHAFIHTNTHTHTYIYLCVCVWASERVYFRLTIYACESNTFIKMLNSIYLNMTYALPDIIKPFSSSWRIIKCFAKVKLLKNLRHRKVTNMSFLWRFVNMHPGANFIKLFLSVIYEFSK